MTDDTTPSSFRAHVELTAQNAAPQMQSDVYESVEAFYVAEIAFLADVDERHREFEPDASNEWLRPESAGAVVYSPRSSTEGFPFTFVEYIEGDVRRYNSRGSKTPPAPPSCGGPGSSEPGHGAVSTVARSI